MRQRLIGGLVVLVIASTMMILIFDGGGGYSSIAVIERIPERQLLEKIDPPIQVIPQIRGGSVDTPELSSQKNPNAELPQNKVSNEAAVIIPIEAIDETPSLSSEGLPEGFVIQMGVFSNFNNGERLRLQLISDGYKAYSRKSSSENGGRMTIFVGPWLDRNRVEAFREELNQKYQVLGLIKRYELESL